MGKEKYGFGQEGDRVVLPEEGDILNSTQGKLLIDLPFNKQVSFSTEITKTLQVGELMDITAKLESINTDQILMKPLLTEKDGPIGWIYLGCNDTVSIIDFSAKTGHKHYDSLNQFLNKKEVYLIATDEEIEALRREHIEVRNRKTPKVHVSSGKFLSFVSSIISRAPHLQKLLNNRIDPESTIKRPMKAVTLWSVIIYPLLIQLFLEKNGELLCNEKQILHVSPNTTIIDNSKRFTYNSNTQAPLRNNPYDDSQGDDFSDSVIDYGHYMKNEMTSTYSSSNTKCLETPTSSSLSKSDPRGRVSGPNEFSDLACSWRAREQESELFYARAVHPRAYEKSNVVDLQKRSLTSSDPVAVALRPVGKVPSTGTPQSSRARNRRDDSQKQTIPSMRNDRCVIYGDAGADSRVVSKDDIFSYIQREIDDVELCDEPWL